MNYTVLNQSKLPVKAWVNGVAFDDNTKSQLLNLASMPFIHKWVAAMPDTHMGKGAAIGSVIATDKAIIPAAVGVDLGCGMKAVKTGLTANDLPDDLSALRNDIEAVIPVGFGKRNLHKDNYYYLLVNHWENVNGKVVGGGIRVDRFDQLCLDNPKANLEKSNNIAHMGTLGGGNHFIEICLDENSDVWIMLHSGSRGVGNRIGNYFIEKAREEIKRWFYNIPDQDLAYLPEGSKYFDKYVNAVNWAQDFAKSNRDMMMSIVLMELSKHTKPLINAFYDNAEDTQFEMVTDCHHNYVQKENHYGKNVWVTRKGAVSAREGELGIIPGSMGAKSFIVRGLGNAESFCSCSHGAGRVMSRTQAKKLVSLEEHRQAVAGVECRVDESVIDETPSAYKDIDAVMAAQEDLVEIVHTLKQVMCIKG